MRVFLPSIVEKRLGRTEGLTDAYMDARCNFYSPSPTMGDNLTHRYCTRKEKLSIFLSHFFRAQSLTVDQWLEKKQLHIYRKKFIGLLGGIKDLIVSL